MIVTHRSGEPENGGASTTIIGSLIGIPTEKALVSEDHCIEIGGYKTLIRSNEPYDKFKFPRFCFIFEFFFIWKSYYFLDISI